MSFSSNQRAFKATLDELTREAKKSGNELLRQQAKLLVQDCIKLTPPTSGAKGVMSETIGAQKQSGERAVERDINKVIGALGELDLWKGRNKIKSAIQKDIKRGDMEAAANRLGGKKQKPIVALDIPKDYHKKFRNSRGRIKKPDTRLYVPKKADKAAYIKEAKNSVMKGKAGWKKAALKLGLKSLHASIKRHAGKGMVQDATRDNNPNPTITVANLVKHVQEGGASLRVMSYAFKNRERAMRKSLQEMYGRKAKKAIRKWTSQGLVTPR